MQKNNKSNIIDPYTLLGDEEYHEEESADVKVKKIVKKIIRKKLPSESEDILTTTETEEITQPTEETLNIETNDSNNEILSNLLYFSSRAFLVITNGGIEFANPAALSLLSFHHESELHGLEFLQIVESKHWDDFANNSEGLFLMDKPYKLSLYKGDGKIITCNSRIRMLCNYEDKFSFSVEFYDNSHVENLEKQNIKMQATLNNSSLTDEITGLPSHLILEDRLAMAIARSTRASYGKAETSTDKIAVLSVNTDKLTQINETYGRDAGDFILQNIGYRLTSSLRQSDTIARAKKDGFTVIAENIVNEEDAETLSRRILGLVLEDVMYKGHDIVISCSIGISIFPDNGTRGKDLIRRSELALDEAKKLGGRQYVLFSPNMEETASPHATSL